MTMKQETNELTSLIGKWFINDKYEEIQFELTSFKIENNEILISLHLITNGLPNGMEDQNVKYDDFKKNYRLFP